MSIEIFKEKVKKNGLAKTNRFILNFGLPQLMQKDMHDLEMVQMFCESISLPSINISSMPIRTFGEQREIPYDRTFEPLNAVFYVDRKMVVKDFFDLWMSSIYNPIDRTLNYYEQYTTDMTIFVLDSADNSTYTIKLYEIYPKSIGQVQLDNNSKDIMKLNVTFNYKYHTGSRLDLLSGQPEISNIYNINKVKGLNGIIPENYYNAGSPFANGVPNEYLTNYISYQEKYVDSLSVSNAINSINTQGIQTGLTSEDF